MNENDFSADSLRHGIVLLIGQDLCRARREICINRLNACIPKSLKSLNSFDNLSAISCMLIMVIELSVRDAGDGGWGWWGGGL